MVVPFSRCNSRHLPALQVHLTKDHLIEGVCLRAPYHRTAQEQRQQGLLPTVVASVDDCISSLTNEHVIAYAFRALRQASACSRARVVSVHLLSFQLLLTYQQGHRIRSQGASIVCSMPFQTIPSFSLPY